jgi:hypothetical protein
MIFSDKEIPAVVVPSCCLCPPVTMKHKCVEHVTSQTFIQKSVVQTKDKMGMILLSFAKLEGHH